MIRDHNDERRGEIVQFGRRPIPPRACIVENKTHVRMFLAEMLDELGFIACEADTLDIRGTLREFRPDLKAIFTSGYSEQFIRGRDEADKGVPLLPKPYRRQKLVDVIRSMLDAAT